VQPVVVGLHTFMNTISGPGISGDIIQIASPSAWNWRSVHQCFNYHPGRLARRSFW